MKQRNCVMQTLHGSCTHTRTHSSYNSTPKICALLGRPKACMEMGVGCGILSLLVKLLASFSSWGKTVFLKSGIRTPHYKLSWIQWKTTYQILFWQEKLIIAFVFKRTQSWLDTEGDEYDQNTFSKPLNHVLKTMVISCNINSVRESD